ncbi:MAG: hypothetical protein JST16_19225 [Bdellovibrionales bacterium]|nr:hypothetical protein [Bdellovibrionales bacterium]
MNCIHIKSFVTLASVVAFVPALAQTTPNIHGLQAETPQFDTYTPPPPRKPTLLTGSLSVAQASALESNLDWKGWAKRCASALSYITSHSIAYEADKGDSYEIIIFPFGLMTTRPPEFRDIVRGYRCPPFPEGSAVQRIVIRGTTIEGKVNQKENETSFIKQTLENTTVDQEK